jgi:hypothetical protein
LVAWSAQFAIQQVYILKFSLEKMNGFVQIERRANPFQIFRGIKIIPRDSCLRFINHHRKLHINIQIKTIKEMILEN